MIKKMEKIFKALGDKNRLKIINMLTLKPLCVCEINSILPLSQSTVSGHLRVLKDAELVESTKDGLWVEYFLNKDHPLSGEILFIIDKIMAEDPVLQEEREKVSKADRNQICKK